MRHHRGKAGTKHPQGVSCLRFSLAGAEVTFETSSLCWLTPLRQVPAHPAIPSPFLAPRGAAKTWCDNGIGVERS